MIYPFEEQRATWLRHERTVAQDYSAQAENEVSGWETSSSSEYSWAPPGHAAVRVPGFTMTSTGTYRARYSPPAYITQQDYNRMDTPGVRERCWQQCATTNDAQVRESMMEPRDLPTPDTHRTGRSRAMSSTSRVSRMLNSASTNGRRSVSSISSALIRTASDAAKHLSGKSQSVMQRVKNRQAKHKVVSVDKSTISRPLSSSSWHLEDGELNNTGATGVIRTDFSAANRAFLTGRRLSSRSSRRSLINFEPSRLRRQHGFGDLQQHRPKTARGPRSDSDGDDYQEFLAAAAEQERQQQSEISSLVSRENADDITTIIEDYLSKGKGIAKHDSHVVQGPALRYSATQEALQRITMHETGEMVFFI